jgi:hypothetical protein
MKKLDYDAWISGGKKNLVKKPYVWNVTVVIMRGPERPTGFLK